MSASKLASSLKRLWALPHIQRKLSYDAAAAAFLERVNGKAIVPGEGDAIVVSDDVACGTLGCGGL